MWCRAYRDVTKSLKFTMIRIMVKGETSLVGLSSFIPSITSNFKHPCLTALTVDSAPMLLHIRSFVNSKNDGLVVVDELIAQKRAFENTGKR